MTDDRKDAGACPPCGTPGVFGYRDGAGLLVWYCERHRLAQLWADARRDGTERTAFDLAVPDHLKPEGHSSKEVTNDERTAF